MLEGSQCERCGTRLPSGAQPGNCPRCLLQHGIEGFADDQEPGSGPESTSDHAEAAPLCDFGDYELLEEIGRGGMGIVYRARQKSLNRIVALKIILAGRWASESQVQRFRAEAEAAAALEHPNIVPIHEIGEHNGQHFFSMKLIEGGNLAQRISSFGCRLSDFPPAVRLLAKLGRAVHYAHQHRVLHRDLKPTNILLDAGNEPHLTDFGLAKRLESASSLTHSHAILGTPCYMAPEQADGNAAQVTTTADIYSLGAVLYELLTGRPPFEAASAIAVLDLVKNRAADPPRKLNSSVDRDLETICLKCLQKEPNRRYGSAEALAEDLERWLAGEPIQARRSSNAERLWRWARRKPVVAALSAAVCLLVVAVAVVSSFSAFRLQRESERTRRAQQSAEEKLWASYLAQARAGRLSAVVGHRVNSLAAVEAAAKMKPSLELRNEAIASLALCDLDKPLIWREYPANPTTIFLAWDAPLERYAVGYPDGRVQVLRATDHQVLAEFHHPAAALFVLFSPNGQYLAATFQEGAARVWDIGRQTRGVSDNLAAMPDRIHTVAFSADSRWLALSGRDQRVHFVDLLGDERVGPLPLKFVPQILQFSPANDVLALAFQSRIELWRWPSLKLWRTLTHRGDLVSLAWHPDGRRLVAGNTIGELVGWDTVSDESLVLQAHTSYVSHLNFSPNGDVAVSHSWDGLTRFWEVATARPLFSTAQGLGTQFSRDGQKLAFHREGVGFGVWRFIRSECFQRLATVQPATDMDLSRDGRWLVYSEAAGWHLWDLAGWKEAAFVPLRGARTPRFMPDQRALLVFTLEEVALWPLLWPTGATSLDGAPQVGAPRVIAAALGSGFERGCVTPDGEWIVVAGRKSSLAVNLKEPVSRVEFARHSGQANVAMSPDHQWIVSSTHNGAGVSLWDASGGFVHRLITNDNCQVAFSLDGKTLVTTSSREYCFWDTRNWQVKHRARVDLGGAIPGPIAFSPDGRLLALAADREDIKLLDATSGAELATLSAPGPRRLQRLSFSGDGSRLAATIDGRAIQLWDLCTLRRELAALGLDWSKESTAP